MNAANRTLLLACGTALMASCSDFYQTDGRATVSGTSVYARAQQVAYAPQTVAPPAPKDSNIAYYVPASSVPRGVRELHIYKKAPVLQQPSPQELLKNAPAPEPEPVVEDSELEHIPDELLEQPAGTHSHQVPAGNQTL